MVRHITITVDVPVDVKETAEQQANQNSGSVEDHIMDSFRWDWDN